MSVNVAGGFPPVLLCFIMFLWYRKGVEHLAVLQGHDVLVFFHSSAFIVGARR
ncbi:hypothetical protein [Natrinema sp. 1APR25-10V2]|uniref:hypothetical protein n=1 Tax=Natrinema sp. 1APR25-10V2 TaxID=2951081 RepID=UPI00287601A0|nr:hypothetical protein [Natrinema sp. 1APR25-10V2]MDS0476826.1 hypothetical protein [Natrinema sp. 1APR25-10V2]